MMTQKMIDDAGAFFIASDDNVFKHTMTKVYDTLYKFLKKVISLNLEEYFGDYYFSDDNSNNPDIILSIYDIRDTFDHDNFMKHHPFFQKYKKIIISS